MIFFKIIYQTKVLKNRDQNHIFGSLDIDNTIRRLQVLQYPSPYMAPWWGCIEKEINMEILAAKGILGIIPFHPWGIADHRQLYHFDISKTG